MIDAPKILDCATDVEVEMFNDIYALNTTWISVVVLRMVDCLTLLFS